MCICFYNGLLASASACSSTLLLMTTQQRSSELPPRCHQLCMWPSPASNTVLSCLLLHSYSKTQLPPPQGSCSSSLAGQSISLAGAEKECCEDGEGRQVGQRGEPAPGGSLGSSGRPSREVPAAFRHRTQLAYYKIAFIDKIAQSLRNTCMSKQGGLGPTAHTN